MAVGFASSLLTSRKALCYPDNSILSGSQSDCISRLWNVGRSITSATMYHLGSYGKNVRVSSPNNKILHQLRHVEFHIDLFFVGSCKMVMLFYNRGLRQYLEPHFTVMMDGYIAVGKS